MLSNEDSNIKYIRQRIHKCMEKVVIFPIQILVQAVEMNQEMYLWGSKV